MQEKNKMGRGFLLILLSALFLFNPVIGFVDPVPNCFGYLLLCLGLSQLADLSESVSESLRRFRILLLLSLAHMLGIYLIYGVMGARSAEMNRLEQPVYILLASFLFLLAQWYFLIPAMRDLFKGIRTLAEAQGADALTRENRKGKTPIDRIRTATTRFVILSSLFAMLPELTILTSFEYEVENRYFPFDWYRFVGLFRILFGFAAFVVGILWLIRMIRVCIKAMKDKPWLDALHERYCREVLPQIGMLTVRRFSGVFFLFRLALIFAISLRFDNQSILPAFFFAILAIFAIYSLGDLVSREARLPVFIASVWLGGVGVAQIFFTADYLKHFLPEASLYQPDAYRAFLIVRAIDVAEVVLTFVLVWILLRFFMSIVTSHTAVDYGSNDARYLSADATKRLHREFRVRHYLSLIFFFIGTCFGIVDAWFRLEYPWMWIPAALFTVVGIACAYSFLFELKTQIQYTYRSNGMNKNQ